MVDRGQGNGDSDKYAEKVIRVAKLKASLLRRIHVLKNLAIMLFVIWVVISAYTFIFVKYNLAVVGLIGLTGFSLIFVFWKIYADILKDKISESWAIITFEHIDLVHELLFKMADRDAGDPIPAELKERAKGIIEEASNVSKKSREMSTQYDEQIIYLLKVMSAIELIVVIISTTMISFSFV